jgi:imidazolonepropionase-like amidohydrolase
MPLRSLFLVAILAACDSPTLPTDAATESHQLLILHGATLFDGTGAPMIPDAYVVIENGRILDVGSGAPPIVVDATTIDVSRKFIVPGFTDTHFHVDVAESGQQELLSTALSFGITSIRDTGPDLGKGVAVRDRLATGQLHGPRMITAGQIIDSTGGASQDYPTVSTPEEMLHQVRRQIATRVDGIKLYMWLPPELVKVGIEEAHAAGVQAIGHIKTTSWTEAAKLGIDVLVHSGSDGPAWELLPEDERADFPDLDWSGFLRQWARTAKAVDFYGPEMESLIAALLANDVEVNPTLVLMEALYWGDDIRHLQRLEPQYAGEALKELWGAGWQDGNPFMAQFNFSAADFSMAKEAFTVTQRMIALFHERGVRVTAGTDVSMPWIAPGASFHRELVLLEQSGIPTKEVLMIATSIGADAIGLIAETGTVEPGKSGDLVVLNRDPLEKISNTRSIEFVLFKGARIGSSLPSTK